MQSHHTIFTKNHNAQSAAKNEVNEIFECADKYLDFLLGNSEGMPLHTDLLYLSAEVTKFKIHLVHNINRSEQNEVEARLAAREFRNVFSIACHPELSADEKIKQIELFRNHMRGSPMNIKDRLANETMFAIGLALIPVVAIIFTSIIFTPVILVALSVALPILAAVSIIKYFNNADELSNPRNTRGEDLSTHMVSMVKNHQHLFAKPKMTEIAPPSYEQARYAMA